MTNRLQNARRSRHHRISWWINTWASSLFIINLITTGPPVSIQSRLDRKPSSRVEYEAASSLSSGTSVIRFSVRAFSVLFGIVAR